MKREILITASALVLCMSAAAQTEGNASSSPPAQSAALAASASTPVPALVPISGLAVNAEGKPLGAAATITFQVFKDPQGGEPLWVETQAIALDPTGKFTAQLGATLPNGIPLELFQSGDARWLEVQIAGQLPQPRSLLASVPYAMKAANAETLGGLSAQNFVTQAQLAEISKDLAGKASSLITPFVTPTGSGITNDIPLWTSSTALGNSVMSQGSGNISIGTTSTPASLTVAGNISNFASGTYSNFTSTAYNSVNYEGPRMAFNRYEGTLAAPTAVKPNDTVGWFDFFAYDGSTADRVGQFSMFVDATPSSGVVPGRFEIETASSTGADTARLIAYSNDNIVMSTHGGKVGIGTGSPAATLEVNGTAKFDGNITFASTQTFPVKGTGGGTITGITTTSPLTGSGTSGSVALGLNTTALETSLNSVYAQLGTNNTFTGYISASESAGPGFGAILGTGTNGADGVQAYSDSGRAVVGSSSSGTGLSAYSVSGNGGYFSNTDSAMATVYAINYSNSSGSTLPVALNGTATGLSSVGVSGTGTSIGVWGNTTAVGANSIYGTAVEGYGGYFSNSGTSYPAAFAENTAGAGTSAAVPMGFEAWARGNSADGVYGFANANGGIGVWGEADGAIDTSGTGRSPVGVKGNATGNDGYGVVGDESGTGGVGVYAHASGAYDSTRKAALGVYGLADSGSGVVGTASGQSATYNSLTTPSSISAGTGGVWGDTSQGPDSQGGTYAIAGVVGTADDNEAGYFQNNAADFPTLEAFNSTGGTAGTLFKVFKASTPEGTCGIGHDGSLACTGQMKALVTSSDGAQTVETYSVQSSENWMEDAGSGELQRGVAVVTIDPAFARTISTDASYHVFLTPNGDSKGLYVIAKTPTTFEVRESGGGTSSLTFDYRIMARRRGFEAQRLVDVTEKFKAEQAEIKRHTPANASAQSSPGLVESNGIADPLPRIPAHTLTNNLRPGAGSIQPPAPLITTPSQKTTPRPAAKTIASAATTEPQK